METNDTKVNRGIVITTTFNNKEWLSELLKSICYIPYPIVVVCNNLEPEQLIPWVEGYVSLMKLYPTQRFGSSSNCENGFEIEGIRVGKDKFEEFIYLHDTVIVKDVSLFDKLFEMKGHVALTDGFYHYFGKYVSSDLPELPEVKNKEDAVFWELRWFTKPYSVFEPQLPVLSDVFEEINGRTNMVLENEYLIKYKNRWA